MAYTVRYVKGVKQQLQRLSDGDRKAIFKKIKALEQDAEPPGSRRLDKDGPLLRVKAKDIRAIYSDPNANNEIDLLYVGHFKDAYREANLLLLRRMLTDD